MTPRLGLHSGAHHEAPNADAHYASWCSPFPRKLPRAGPKRHLGLIGPRAGTETPPSASSMPPTVCELSLHPYDATTLYSNGISRPNPDIPRQIIDALGGSHARILDLGCGTGLSSLLFFEQGHDVTGIDGVGAMVRRARKLPYKKVIQQDLESRWRVKDDSFDAAVMLGVMEYIIYPHVLLRQVHDKLVPGGLFGFTVPHKSALYEKDGLKSYYAKEIRPVTVKSGFEILRSEKTLGYVDDGDKVVYWNYLVRKRTHA
jgi:SAM-dependent methyltransferase